MRKQQDLILSVFWICLSILVMLGSYKLGLQSFQNPGPGLLPFLLGASLLLTSIFIGFRSISDYKRREEAIEAKGQPKAQYYKVVITPGILIVYAVLLEKIGYPVDTLLLLLLLFKVAGMKSWKGVLLAALLSVISTYLLFTYLGLRLPKGIFS